MESVTEAANGEAGGDLSAFIDTERFWVIWQVRLPERGGNCIRRISQDYRTQARGVDIVRRALQAPLRRIAENAGVDGAVVAGRLLADGDETQGFNAQTEIYEDLIEAGVIDPAKVVRAALQDAASVAAMIVTTEAGVTDLPDDDLVPGTNYG